MQKNLGRVKRKRGHAFWPVLLRFLKKCVLVRFRALGFKHLVWYVGIHTGMDLLVLRLYMPYLVPGTLKFNTGRFRI